MVLHGLVHPFDFRLKFFHRLNFQQFNLIAEIIVSLQAYRFGVFVVIQDGHRVGLDIERCRVAKIHHGIGLIQVGRKHRLLQLGIHLTLSLLEVKINGIAKIAGHSDFHDVGQIGFLCRSVMVIELVVQTVLCLFVPREFLGASRKQHHCQQAH